MVLVYDAGKQMYLTIILSQSLDDISRRFEFARERFSANLSARVERTRELATDNAIEIQNSRDKVLRPPNRLYASIILPSLLCTYSLIVNSKMYNKLFPIICDNL